MPAPRNLFKAKLKAKETQIGCWLGMAEPYIAEIAGHTGFDVLVIDGEHAPNDVKSMLGQLQALAPSAAQPLLRLPVGQIHLVKQALDIGAQSLLVPMIESGEQAAEMAKAILYPPRGVRGVGAALARASSFSTIKDYLVTANEEICLLLQVESLRGLAALDDILEVDGIDGIFIGPSDLAADMGLPGKNAAPEVRDATARAVERIHASDKAAGILTTDHDYAKTCIEIGVEFVAVAIDVMVYVQGMKAVSAKFKGER